MKKENLLRIEGIGVDCVIGDRPEEREREQRLRVDVELELDLSRAATSDDLADTVDYAALADAIRRTLRTARCRLVERAAALALAECRRDPRVAGARVTVTKAGAVPGVAAAVVTLAEG